MYRDRMEILSSGGLYGKITIDALGKVRPETRNAALANILELLHITENRYSGIPTIRNECTKAGLPAPVFSVLHIFCSFLFSFPALFCHLSHYLTFCHFASCKSIHIHPSVFPAAIPKIIPARQFTRLKRRINTGNRFRVSASAIAQQPTNIPENIPTAASSITPP